MPLTAGDIAGFLTRGGPPQRVADTGTRAFLSGMGSLGDAFAELAQSREREKDRQLEAQKQAKMAQYRDKELARAQRQLEEKSRAAQVQEKEKTRSAKAKEAAGAEQRDLQARRFAAEALGSAQPLMMSGDPQEMEMARALLNLSGVESSPTPQRPSGPPPLVFEGEAAPSMIPREPQGPPGFDFSFGGEQIGSLNTAGVPEEKRRQVEEFMTAFAARERPQDQAAALQMASAAEEALQMFDHDVPKATEFLMDAYQKRTGREGSLRKSLIGAAAARDVAGKGEEGKLTPEQSRLRRGWMTTFNLQLKSNKFHQKISQMQLLSQAVRELKSDNASAHMNALVALRNAREPGVMTDKDFARAMGFMSVQDMAALFFTSKLEGSGLPEAKRAELIRGSQIIHKQRMRDIRGVYETMKAAREAGADDLERGAADTVIKSNFGRFGWDKEEGPASATDAQIADLLK